jgi:hypothetical protein
MDLPYYCKMKIETPKEAEPQPPSENIIVQ